MASEDAERIAAAFRAEWPRILAALIRFTGDVDLAEDAAQEAFARALAARDRALLINPGAWITTVAKRIAIDAARHDAVLRARLPLLAEDAPQEAERPPGDDDRLGLLFLACAPELTPETRLALALRFVCGVPTEAIAEALLVEHRAMSARLTRAKRRIADEGIRFATPDPAERLERLDDVLATVYVLYTTGHAHPVLPQGETTAAALELARALRRVYPEHREVAGLLSLLLLTEARSSTRVGAGGGVVTLEEADRREWDVAAIQQGLDLAVEALPGGGRFALQAAIAGVHAEAPSWRRTDWASIHRLYDRLLEVWPSPAAALARVVALSYDADGPDAALVELEALEPELSGVVGRTAVAVRADLLRRIGRLSEARAAYIRARSVETDPPTRDFFGRRIAELDASPLPQDSAGFDGASAVEPG